MTTEIEVKTKFDDLYFIRSERGPVKIGRSRNVKARLKSLRCASADELSLIGVLPGEGWQEDAWHAAFADDRIRGEWFDWSADINEARKAALEGRDWTAVIDEYDAHDAEMMLSLLIYRCAPEHFDEP